jgi:hypothetical protein
LSTTSRQTDRAGTHIIGEPVQGAVIAEGLLTRLLEDVVLGDKVGGAGVEATGEEGAGDEVGEGLPAKGPDDEIVEDALDEEVEGVPGGEALGADEAGPEGVEKDLKGAVRALRLCLVKAKGRCVREESLASDILEAEQLGARWQVGVDAVFAQELVVLPAGQCAGILRKEVVSTSM